MTGSAVKLFREVRPARPPSSAWSAFWNPRRAARRWREKCWWAYPVARIPWPAKVSWEFRGPAPDPGLRHVAGQVRVRPLARSRPPPGLG